MYHLCVFQSHKILLIIIVDIPKQIRLQKIIPKIPFISVNEDANSSHFIFERKSKIIKLCINRTSLRSIQNLQQCFTSLKKRQKTNLPEMERQSTHIKINKRKYSPHSLVEFARFSWFENCFLQKQNSDRNRIAKLYENNGSN